MCQGYGYQTLWSWNTICVCIRTIETNIQFNYTLCEKCPNREFFWSIFFRIRTLFTQWYGALVSYYWQKIKTNSICLEWTLLLVWWHQNPIFTFLEDSASSSKFQILMKSAKFNKFNLKWKLEKMTIFF